METILDLERFPLDSPERVTPLVARCRGELADTGMFNLEALVRPDAIETILAEVDPVFAGHAFTHARRHNIYFRRNLDDLPAEHPARAEFVSSNQTICADQMAGQLLTKIYQWAPLRNFLARVMEMPALYEMADPLARMNVMRYHRGEALNWHFDRSEFTTTLLLQSSDLGGEFQYQNDLRSDTDPNYDAVGAFVAGDQSGARTLRLAPGTLNVFRGRNTAHRITPVEGERSRMVAVFSYYDRPGVLFTEDERIGFYGRAG